MWRDCQAHLEAWHLAFLLGPRINAGGRIGQADLGVKLLLEEDATEAGRIAEELNRLNVQRQAIERDCVLQAEAEAEASLGKDDNVPVVVTAAEGWHPGVVGLIAARLKERYGRPSFAIALGAGGIGTAPAAQFRARISAMSCGRLLPMVCCSRVGGTPWRLA